jgi:serine/threonine-protein kinase
MTRGLERWLGLLRQQPPATSADVPRTVVVTPPADPPPEADRLDARFVTLGEIGRGGMGSVQRVFDQRLLREMALKVLDPRLGDHERRLARFLEEARVTGQLEHPNIVPVHDLGSDDSRSRWYFSMKLVQGVTLHQIIDRAGPDRLEPDTLADLLQVFIKCCEAVAFAHSRGVIHRDLKPSNVMVGEFGQVYVMDWGVARIRGAAAEADGGSPTETDAPGDVIGTPCYMSPEQARGAHESVDERSDVFTLGATLFHLLAGRPPYDGRTYYAVLIQALQRRCLTPEEIEPRVPPALSRIAMRAMAADPAERYASASELQRAVEDFLRGGWHLPTETFPAGTLVLEEGEPGDAAYIIVKGRCEVFKAGTGGAPRVLRVMGPGEVFGETAILTRAPRTASIRALDDVTLMVVREDALTEALGLNAWMGRFVTALARRFREVDARVGELEREVETLRRRPPGNDEA